MAVKNLRDGKITIKDGTGTPNTVELTCDNGLLEFDEAFNNVPIYDRAALDHWRKGRDEPKSVSFEVDFSEYQSDTGGSDVTPAEALKQAGNASGWASVASSGDYCVDLEFQIAAVDSGEVTEILTFGKFVADSIAFSEGEEKDTLRVEGRAFTLVRTQS